MEQFGRVAELPVVEGAYITLRTANPPTHQEGEEDPFSVSNCLVETILTESEDCYDGYPKNAVVNRTVTLVPVSEPPNHHQPQHQPQHLVHSVPDPTPTPLQHTQNVREGTEQHRQQQIYTHLQASNQTLASLADGMTARNKKSRPDQPNSSNSHNNLSTGTYQCDLCPYRAKMKSHLKTHRQSLHEGVKYPCDQCEYRATAMGSLRRHYIAIHSGMKYPCSECDHVSNTASNLKYHHNTVHMGLRFPCNRCSYKATTASHLKKHKESVHEGITYDCGECEYKATTKESLKVHRRSQHRKIVYPCTGCDYTAKVQSHLRQHIRSVHEKVRYPCDACDSTFINNSRLKHHKQTVHSGLRFTCERHTLDVMNSKTMKKVLNGEMKFDCVDCNAAVQGSLELVRHQKLLQPAVSAHINQLDQDIKFNPHMEVGDDKVRYKCASCPHEARNPAELRQHVMGKHEGVTHACNLCSFTTTHPSSLKRHRLNQHAELRFACDAHSSSTSGAVAGDDSHKGNVVRSAAAAELLLEQELKYDCEDCCHVARTSLDILRSREASNNTVSGAFSARDTEADMGIKKRVQHICDTCGHEGRNPSDLRQHRLSVHEGVTYGCDQCDFLTSRPDSLKRHHKIRHEEKRFVCEECDFRTISAGMLSRHKLRSHVGVSFPCHLCNYKSSRAGKLKQHRLLAHPTAHQQQHQHQSAVPEPCQTFQLHSSGILNYSSSSSQPVPSYQQQQQLFACHHCPLRATSHADLTDHLTALHRDIKPPGSESGGGGCGGMKIEGFLYPCDKCEFRSETAQALRKHRQTAHLAFQDLLSEGSGDSSRFACSKCEYSSASRFSFKAHVARMHGVKEAAGGEEVKKEAATDDSSDSVACSQPLAVGFQPMLPLYAAAGGGGETVMRLQPTTVLPSVVPVYHLTVKGPDNHIFTLQPVAAGQQEIMAGKLQQQQQATFIPVAVGKNGEYTYQQQSEPVVGSGNGGSSVAGTTEAAWRPDYDTYLSSV